MELDIEEMKRLAVGAGGTLVHGWGSPVKVDSMDLEKYTRWVIQEIEFRMLEQELEDNE